MTSRRDFLGQSTLAAVGLTLPGFDTTNQARDTQPGAPAPRGFVDLRRSPDSMLVQTSTGNVSLTLEGNGRWTGGGVLVTLSENGTATNVVLSASTTAVKRIRIRWRANMTGTRQLLGDAWERGYGDLEWRTWIPDRVMPWYAATYDGTLRHAYGVRTGARSFCYWQIDPQGISLWTDVRSGSAGVQLGPRTLDVCDVVCRSGRADETAYAAVHAFCAQMCRKPRLPSLPVYGSNDWYWAYGRNSAETVLTDTKHIVELSPTGDNRPYSVIDDGWQPERSKDKLGVGTWDHGNEKFPDMANLASEIKRAESRAGIWIRPLQATKDTPDSWRLPRDKNYLDPTIPDVLKKVGDDIARLRQWGYELIKHDYTTYDLFGRWGSQMGAAITRDGWTFASGSSRTNAEVINELYAAIRNGAGSSVVIGCNTVSHLSASQFEMCRIGDDTSGTEWPRTRKMGVNSLAFRGPQHGTFYVADADCVGVTNNVPWDLNRQWLDLLARSGTMLFVSLAPDALGADQRRDLKAALAIAAVPQPLAEPLDWQQTVYPARWKMQGRERKYDWTGPDGDGAP